MFRDRGCVKKSGLKCDLSRPRMSEEDLDSDMIVVDDVPADSDRDLGQLDNNSSAEDNPATTARIELQTN